MSYHVIVIVGRNKSFSNQVLSTLGWAGSTLAPTRKDLLNPTSKRDASHPCLISTWPKEGCTILCVCTIVYVITHTTVHPSLGQELIRSGWEASLFDVGLSKSLQVGARVDPAHSKVTVAFQLSQIITTQYSFLSIY